MLAVTTHGEAPGMETLTSRGSLSDLSMRNLFTADEEDDDLMALPTVTELLVEVGRLQLEVGQLGPANADLDADIESLDGSENSMTMVGRRPRLRSDPRLPVGLTRADLNASFSSDNGVLPKRRSTSNMSARMLSTVPRVAALTKENISLLRAPSDRRNYAGSVAGSQQSRTSVRTDGGAVFSRLYQPDFYKQRDAKLKSLKDRQEINFSFLPRTNHRSSISSRDSIGSSSVSSMRSTNTDVLNVSSRLYDPEYMRKRTAKLQRMREEREMRNCTFTPTINRKATPTTTPAATPSKP
ncbi:hypothetical protein Poli38472_013498 [Pythium oligandrum]|uniref:Uncharacterized protein n=1 Tax=Pythium oligandrum TaxID=41045 RepID=A0A8K1C7T2_PYTOL|nr:hypothetical protein Poli38472_013498 [Pythium oligandrum]|eukprot:TMW58024.1 hypothetical protein Poli38472_013498 [Pythium oligandrum]